MLPDIWTGRGERMAGSSWGPPTRPSLLRRIRDPRDAEAWNVFVEVYGPLVYRHCRRRGLQHADAEDVTQQVFAQVNRSIRAFEYRSEEGRFRDWLGTLTRNKVYRFWKRQAGEVPAQGRGEGPDGLNTVPAPEPDTEWAEEFNRHVLETAVARVRPRLEDLTWRAFELG